jgi:hypothetical protein
VKAAGQRTIADLRAEALRGMVTAMPTVLDGVEAVARDKRAPARDRVLAFKVLADKVFPTTSGHDHVGAAVAAEARADQAQAQADQPDKPDKPAQLDAAGLLALLRVPRAELEQRIVEQLSDFWTEDQARTLLDAWYARLNAFDVSDQLKAIVDEAWEAAITVDEPEAIEAVTVDDDDTDEIEEISAPSANRHADPAVAALVEYVGARGMTLGEFVDDLTADDEHESEDTRSS